MSGSLPVTLRTRYYASIGDLVFGEEDVVTHPGGTFDWQPFSADLNMPADVPVAPDQTSSVFCTFRLSR